eukprot:TRINITY_DN23074_c0_g1_i1.p2 TRINITY_DN23074_c0_g1~~TRINITY_DN23074_c0_g1_i1.p2  ORF type:complete len:129 (+),score=26.35 TRINITY_DN23074_c0_g1_i1:154-540(+)
MITVLLILTALENTKYNLLAFICSCIVELTKEGKPAFLSYTCLINRLIRQFVPPPTDPGFISSSIVAMKTLQKMGIEKGHAVGLELTPPSALATLGPSSSTPGPSTSAALGPSTSAIPPPPPLHSEEF